MTEIKFSLLKSRRFIPLCKHCRINPFMFHLDLSSSKTPNTSERADISLGNRPIALAVLCFVQRLKGTSCLLPQRPIQSRTSVDYYQRWSCESSLIISNKEDLSHLFPLSSFWGVLYTFTSRAINIENDTYSNSPDHQDPGRFYY